MNTNERDRKADQFSDKLTKVRAYFDHNDERIANFSYRAGWDACESSERVRGLVEALKKIAGPIQGATLKGYGPSASAQRRQIANQALAAWGDG